MPAYTSPGLYLEEVHTAVPKDLPTGVPVFLGYVRRPDAGACSLTHWSHFAMRFGEPADQGYLAYAVRGFFENGGKICYVVPLDNSEDDPEESLQAKFHSIRALEDPDLLCAPDLSLSPSGETRDADLITRLQARLLHPSPRGGDPRRFVILDSLPEADPAAERKHCAALLQAAREIGAYPEDLAGAALYYPWLAVPRFVPPGDQAAVGEDVDMIMVPPCGHVAGIYARTDEGAGIRKAPANETLHGVLDLRTRLSDGDQAAFFGPDANDQVAVPPGAVNCVRAFPGRGVRIWGARTLSSDPEWRYVNVRRLFLHAIRWIERKMNRVAFSQNDPSLWARIRRELNAYCFELFQRGALKGATINEAFYVRCDESLNPPEVRDSGMVMVEVGLAAARPNEFIVIRLIHRDTGVTTTGVSADSL